MTTGKQPKPRPYWHVDAKWITGILLLVLLSATFFSFLLVQITGPTMGIELLTGVLASSFSAQGGGLDATGDFDIMKQKVADSPTGAWQPIPGMQIYVREADIAGKTPREVRFWFFRQWAEPIYYKGTSGLESLITDPKMKEDLQDGIGPLGVISAANNQKLTLIFAISALVSVIFLVMLVIFSHRFGRLGSPGCVVFLVALPGFALFGLLKGWLGHAVTQPVSGEETFFTRYTQLAADVLPAVVQRAMVVYLVLMLAGLVLMLVALVLGLVFREKKKAE